MRVHAVRHDARDRVQPIFFAVDSRISTSAAAPSRSTMRWRR